MRVFRFTFLLALYIGMTAIMVKNVGWGMAGIMIAALFTPFLVFGLLPYLLGSRPGTGKGKGYFFGYEYKFGAKRPKF